MMTEYEAFKEWCDPYARNEGEAWEAWQAACAWQRAQPAGESVETEQSIAADCYHWIADRIGTRDGYSVQEHIDAICNVLDECADYFHDLPESAADGDNEGVRIAANLRALKAGKLEDVDDAAPPAAANQAGIPEGYVLVPKEPTDKWSRTLARKSYGGGFVGDKTRLKFYASVIRDVLAAAPHPAEKE